MNRTAPLAALLLGALLLVGAVSAQEAAIRKNLADRLPNFPKIDEITKTAIPGLYEIRIGTDILYSDEQGDHIVQGALIDTRTRTNLTDARIDKLTAVEFGTLPLKDAMAFKQGSGQRKMAVFVDPNCGYCKRFERDLVQLKDVTIYAFLYPILGPDSNVKARDIWCAKDAAKTWRSWMIDGVTPPKVTASCDSAALERNVEFGRKHRVNGTPAMFFEDGTRRPGAMSAEQVEKLLSAARKS